MLIKVTLLYDCEGEEAECIRRLNDSYRPLQGRTESFSGCYRREDAILSARGTCVAYKIEREP